MLDRTKLVEKLIQDTQLFRRKASMHLHSKKTDITGSEWFVIGFIAKNEETTTNETAAALQMTGSAVTQLVNGLVSKGYVKRKQSHTDKRVQKLVLSAQSKRRIAEFKKKRTLRMLKMFEALTDEEFKQYCRLSDKIASAMGSE